MHSGLVFNMPFLGKYVNKGHVTKQKGTMKNFILSIIVAVKKSICLAIVAIVFCLLRVLHLLLCAFSAVFRVVLGKLFNVLGLFASLAASPCNSLVCTLLTSLSPIVDKLLMHALPTNPHFRVLPLLLVAES